MDFQIFHIPDKSDLPQNPSGKNEKQLAILLSEPSQNFLTLLKNVLGAISYDLDRDCVVYSFKTDQKVCFADLDAAAPFTHLLSFGVSPQQAGLQITWTPYSWLNIKERQLLFTHGLDKIDADKNLKRQLWGELKGMFVGKA